MANSFPAVVVRIKGANSEGKDWLIPGEVSFRMVLVSQGPSMDKLAANRAQLGTQSSHMAYRRFSC